MGDGRGFCSERRAREEEEDREIFPGCADRLEGALNRRRVKSFEGAMRENEESRKERKAREKRERMNLSFWWVGIFPLRMALFFFSVEICV